jgi:tetratricopeptide (TPR) repeat protein
LADREAGLDLIVTKRDPSNSHNTDLASAYVDIGQTYAKQNKPDQAIGAYTKATELDGYPDSRIGRGAVYMLQGNMEGAGKDFAYAAIRFPKRALGRYAYGVLLLRLGRDAEGRLELAAAYVLVPDVAEQAEPFGIPPQ